MSIPIVFGQYHNRKTAGEGVWFCPNCETQTPYKQKELICFCHICFIPICCAPEMEYIKCKRCEQQFEQAVLENNETVKRSVLVHQAARHDIIHAFFEKVMLRSMILVMMANGKESPAQKETIERIYCQEFHRTTPDNVRYEMEQFARMDGNPKDNILNEMEALCNTISQSDKDMLAKALVMVAAADGDLEVEEAEVLAEAAKRLGMPVSEMKKLLHAELHGKDEEN